MGAVSPAPAHCTMQFAPSQLTSQARSHTTVQVVPASQSTEVLPPCAVNMQFDMLAQRIEESPPALTSQVLPIVQSTSAPRSAITVQSEPATQSTSESFVTVTSQVLALQSVSVSAPSVAVQSLPAVQVSEQPAPVHSCVQSTPGSHVQAVPTHSQPGPGHSEGVPPSPPPQAKRASEPRSAMFRRVDMGMGYLSGVMYRSGFSSENRS